MFIVEPLGCHFCGNDFQLCLDLQFLMAGIEAFGVKRHGGACQKTWGNLSSKGMEILTKSLGEILWPNSAGMSADVQKMKTQMINGYKCLRREQTQTLRIKKDKQIRNLS